MTQMSVYTAKEIMEIIPHRHPFMLIDTIEELEPGGVHWAGNASALMNRILPDIFRESCNARSAYC